MADETVLTDKGQILAQMSERRQALLSALDEAGPELIERPGTWNNWTLKDLMAHIIYWQTVAIDRLQKTIAGRRDEIEPAGDEDAIDRINEKVYRANKDRPLAEMRDLFHTTYLSLRTAVKSIPAGLFAESQPDGGFSVARTVYGDGYGHDEEHLADVERALGRTAGA